MDGEIVNKVPEQLPEEIEKTELSVGDKNPNTTLLIRESLEKKGYGIDKLLDMAIDIAENAYKTPANEMGVDFGKKLKALELMMEASGYVKRKNGVEVKFSLSKLLYNK